MDRFLGGCCFASSTKPRRLLVSTLVNDIVKRGNGRGVVPAERFILLLIILLVIWVTVSILGNVQGYLGDMLGAKPQYVTEQRITSEHLLKLPLEYYDNEITGKITSRLDRSISTISNLMQAFANNFIGFFLTSIFTLVILARYSWPVAILLTALFPLYILADDTLSKPQLAKRNKEGINRDTDAANGRFIEAISPDPGGKILCPKKSPRANSLVASVHQDRGANPGPDRSSGTTTITLVRLMPSLYLLWHLRHYCLAGSERPVWSGTASGGYRGVVAATNPTGSRCHCLLRRLLLMNIQRAIAGSKDFFSVMELEPTITDKPEARDLKGTEGGVVYQNVDFAYNEGQ